MAWKKMLLCWHSNFSAELFYRGASGSHGTFMLGYVYDSPSKIFSDSGTRNTAVDKEMTRLLKK